MTVYLPPYRPAWTIRYAPPIDVSRFWDAVGAAWAVEGYRAMCRDRCYDDDVEAMESVLGMPR